MSIDKRSYTEAELYRLAEDGALPGLLEPTTFGSHLFMDTVWQPAIMASLLRSDEAQPTPADRLFIASGIRNPDINATHQDVVSLPTWRLDDTQARDIAASTPPFATELRSVVIGRDNIVPGTILPLAFFAPDIQPVGEGALGSAAQGMFDEKLDGKYWEAAGHPAWAEIGQVSLHMVAIGFSGVGENDNGECLIEPLMEFCVVGSTKDPSAMGLPIQTRYYRGFRFTNIGDFADNVNHRRVGSLVHATENDRLFGCVYGTCLEVGKVAVSDPELALKHMGQLT